jgi:hypothetical protein
MADHVTAKNSDAKFKSHPEGQFVGQCVDCIDMGEVVQDFPDKPKYLAQKCALVFRTGEKNDETGEFIDVVGEFTVSMGENANLRKFLEQWRGRPYTQDQVDEGVPLDKLVGNWALLTISQKPSKKGRMYAVIVSAVGVPKQMQGSLTPWTGFVRPKYLVDRKAENVKATQAYRLSIGAPQAGRTHKGDDPGPTEPEEKFFGATEDDLPF